MIKTGNYVGTHYFWDDDDNEFEVRAVWYFERGYPEIPDTWELRTFSYEPDIDLPADDLQAMRESIERDGPPADLEEYDDGRY